MDWIVRFRLMATHGIAMALSQAVDCLGQLVPARDDRWVDPSSWAKHLPNTHMLRLGGCRQATPQPYGSQCGLVALSDVYRTRP